MGEWFPTIVCEQTLRGGAGKGRRACHCHWNLNICVNAKCWLVEMTLVMTSLPLARVFRCLFTFALISASHWLAEIWQLSWLRAHRGIGGEIQIPLTETYSQSATESLLAGYPYKRLSTNIALPQITPHIFWSFPNAMSWSIWFSNWNFWLCHVNGKYPWQIENLVTAIGFGLQINVSSGQIIWP